MTPKKGLVICSLDDEELIRMISLRTRGSRIEGKTVITNPIMDTQGKEYGSLLITPKIVPMRNHHGGQGELLKGRVIKVNYLFEEGYDIAGDRNYRSFVKSFLDNDEVLSVIEEERKERLRTANEEEYSDLKHHLEVIANAKRLFRRVPTEFSNKDTMIVGLKLKRTEAVSSDNPRLLEKLVGEITSETLASIYEYSVKSVMLGLRAPQLFYDE
ncbi:hypothetical protein COU61_01215 [Candidatus Pacearchaeota archaeon CG10_big_fil_rev_8_21_14_0_10_35_13]|nr:MAG: hypothetical protein COU61_01215 [Candidatus Pacearchaeota archaeon CG10_big_fil_rev_8_21_14_0_10_35_13]